LVKASRYLTHMKKLKDLREPLERPIHKVRFLGTRLGQLNPKRLAGWAGAISTWLKEGLAVCCYFDNDEAGYATQDALRLQQMMEG
jgi:uncharacterized protein YecE (DUF72 family)